MAKSSTLKNMVVTLFAVTLIASALLGGSLRTYKGSD
jgi:hypothetical protein